jgi:hypothetical protein
VNNTVSGDRPVIAVANRLPAQRGDDGWELSPGGLAAMAGHVRTHDVHGWVSSQLEEIAIRGKAGPR